MEIGIYITANIIYLVRELYLGDRIGSFSLLERWVVAAPFVGRHFPSVLWPLAGDVRRITCSFIALALDIYVFCLRAEAEGAILHATKKVVSRARFWWNIGIQFTWRQGPCAHPVTWQLVITGLSCHVTSVSMQLACASCIVFRLYC